MKLSRYFTLEEMCFSQEAVRHGIDNVPDDQTIENLKKLCLYVLEPLRLFLGCPIHITSGYRSPQLNAHINGSKTSQHMIGQAADIYVAGLTATHLFEAIIEAEIPFDQLINEFGSWVHISYSERNRKQKLMAKLEDGRTVYVAV